MSYPDITEAGAAAYARQPDIRSGSEFAHSWVCDRCGDVVHHVRPADGICSSCRLANRKDTPDA